MTVRRCNHMWLCPGCACVCVMITAPVAAPLKCAAQPATVAAPCGCACVRGCALELRGSACSRGCARGRAMWLRVRPWPRPAAARACVPVAARLLPLSCVPRLAAPVVACACVRACGSCTRRFGYSQDTITNCRDVPPLRPGRSLGCPRHGGAGGPGPGLDLRLHVGRGVPVLRLQRHFVRMLAAFFEMCQRLLD